MTTNTPITESKTWQLVTMAIMTNRGAYDLEFLVNDTLPTDSTLGHILEPRKGVSADELPTGNVYVRSVYGDSLLVISE